MRFDEWMTRCSPLSIKRMYESVKWRWWRGWPILAMRAGWNARRACERLERRVAKVGGGGAEPDEMRSPCETGDDSTRGDKPTRGAIALGPPAGSEGRLT